MRSAAEDDYARAAQRLGLTYTTFVGQLNAARRAAREAWFFPETAPRWRRPDQRLAALRRSITACPKGHPYTPENCYYQASRRSRQCRTCRRERRVAARARKEAGA